MNRPLISWGVASITGTSAFPGSTLATTALRRRKEPLLKNDPQQSAFQRDIYTFRYVLITGSDMGEVQRKKIDVVYEDGVFKPLGDVKLSEGTEAFVVIKPGRILDATRRHRIKVDNDVLKEFTEERR